MLRRTKQTSWKVISAIAKVRPRSRLTMGKLATKKRVLVRIAKRLSRSRLKLRKLAMKKRTLLMTRRQMLFAP